jgi:ankyrin repeat protein
MTLKPQLYAAASVNNTEQVLQYLDMGVPVNHLDQRSGFTALHWAALNGNVVMVKRLLEW